MISTTSLYTIDIETRSLLNIKVAGLKYVLSRYTQEILISICDEDYNILRWNYFDKSTHGNKEKMLQLWRNKHHIFFAHNGNSFDFIRLWKFFGEPPGNAVDTLSLFAPYIDEKQLNLDTIAKQFGSKKDSGGKDLIQRYCLPKHFVFMEPNETFQQYAARTNRHTFSQCFSVPDKADLTRFVQYCDSDTIELMKLLKRIKYNKLDKNMLHLYETDRKINYRGIRVDLKLADFLINQAALLQQRLITDAGIPYDVISSTKKFTKYIRENHNVLLTKCNIEYLEDTLNDTKVGEEVKKLIRARLSISKRCDAKVKKIKSLCVGDRLYNYLRVDGAHTGRWTSGGAQMHNLPGDKTGVFYEALDRYLSWENYAAYQNGEYDIADNAEIVLRSNDEVQALTRALFLPDAGKKFYICDYSGIEARIAAWLAGDDEKVKGFENGVDFYKVNAAEFYKKPVSEITKVERKVGKVAELGCGYQMGPKRFVDYAAAWGVAVDLNTASEVVNAWRDKNSKIAGERNGRTYKGNIGRTGGLWRDLNVAFLELVQGKAPLGSYTVAKCEMTYTDNKDGSRDIIIQLPSRRKLFYRNVALKMCRQDEHDDEAPREWAQLGGKDYIVHDFHDEQTRAFRMEGFTVQAVYGHTQRHTVYGGKLLENICQAIGNCFLRDALQELACLDFETPLHVHDEIVTQIEKDTDAIRVYNTMSTKPLWAAGMPLDCEGFISDRFVKEPRKVES